MTSIHPTALVDPKAHLGDGVTVGAYSIVKGPVRIGAGTVIHEHTHVQGLTTIGTDCQLGPAAFIGLPPQHLRANADVGQLIIGDQVVVREAATIHRATEAGEDHATRVGNRCFIMGGVHIAHDCVLEDQVIAANGVLLGGHVHISQNVFLGGGCALHQFVRVGRIAIIAGNEAVTQDVPPFAAMRYGGLKAYNAIGCKRAGMSRDTIHAIRCAFTHLHRHRVVSAALEEIREIRPQFPEIVELIDFITSSKRGIVPSLSAHAVALTIGLNGAKRERSPAGFGDFAMPEN
jgi:UDP-N-acetylglucosamine acyltransferase